MPKRGRGKSGRAELSRLETEVMDVVWRLGDCSSAEVTREFRRRRNLAPTTIRSVLANLRKKGYLKPIPSVDRGFRLRATVARDEIARGSLSSLVERLFGGSPGEAVMYLLEDQRIDKEELERIRKLIDSRKKGDVRS